MLMKVAEIHLPGLTFQLHHLLTVNTWEIKETTVKISFINLAGKRAQWKKELVTKADNHSLVPRTHMVEGKN